ncbi:hypothetical protein B0J13DRAFT_208242 [Dactylonectria estremocensis]|uniref:Subtilisin n=1 Tax=Dactylonectria estremocensis TaxID=1079267 RepID=A0A9P9IC84_9HYPO|nr:hypothetical protein B0J13DRAFT_208242 [Dactylonectria estremocensis]
MLVQQKRRLQLRLQQQYLLPYVVYLTEGRNSTMVSELEAVLTGLVEEPADLYASNTNSLGMNFWTLPLNPDEANKLRKDAGVGSVMLQCGSDINPCFDPSTSLMWQEDAESQLSYVSWPNKVDRTPFSDIKGRYYFDDSNGKDVDVWIMDTGATIEHP